MLEIRMLRSTWRGLETWHGRDAVTLADERARQQATRTSTYTGAPVSDPTCERLGVKDSDARDVAYVYTGGAMKRRILADAHVHAPRSSRLAPEKVVREI